LGNGAGINGGVGAVGVVGGTPGNSQNSSQTIPASPGWLKITMTPSATQAGNVRLDWSAVEGAQSYNIYRNLSYVDNVPNEKVVATVPAGTTTFTDTSVPLFIAAFYSVSAVNAVGESDKRDAPVTRAVGTPDALVWGFADTHTHPFVDRAFGGDLFWGRAFGPMNSALADCGKAHPTQKIDAGAVVIGVVIGGLLGPAASVIPIAGPALSLGLGPLLGPIMGDSAAKAFQVMHPGTKGSPTFDSWPRFDTKVHQMMYESWLFRAYVGGLRLMVAHAVNNETICEALQGLGHVASGRTCDDMEAVSLQLQDARDMEVFINSECASGDPALGCVGSGIGWFHVVTSSTEARQTINRGQLAVVLGIEVDHPFGCGRARTCSKTEVDAGLQSVFDLGVRHMFPIHLSDNPFGGMAFYADMFAASSQILNGTPVVATECPVDQIDGKYTFQLTNYPQTATCNIQGLTELGKYLVQNLANRHMIIDVDHMSRKSVEDTFSLLTPFSYPVIAGHNTLMYLHQGGGRTEAARTTGQVMTIKGLGGLVSIGTGDVGTVKDVVLAAQSRIPHNCSNSSQTWFQSYVRTVALTGDYGSAAVPLATDQGLTDMIGPRFKGSIGEACAGGDESEAKAQDPATRVPYPFFTLTPGTPLGLKQSSVPGRTFDFNTEGMAHYGLFPDFVQDLRSQGVTDQELGPLFRSAEAYIQMWSKAEQASVPIPAEHAATAVQGEIKLQVQSGSGSTTSWVIVNATDSKTGVVINGTVMIISPNSPITGSTGSKITFPNCYVVSGVGSQRTKDVTSCAGKVTAPGYSQVTFTAP
jgi:microsomal dipeptidase-like Zn-dependent dipeptidase